MSDEPTDDIPGDDVPEPPEGFHDHDDIDDDDPPEDDDDDG